ncbi:hypothetical protein J2Y63_002404 [Shinella sp. BE166]|uniref:hypothetical protein n=1 Tax=Shinella sp. BE166 TaxID=3373918 RepID=UPI003EBE0C26
MTVFAQTAGQRSLATVSLTDGNEVDLITVSTGETATLESVIACNTSGAGRTFNLSISVKGSAYSVTFEKDVAADDFFHLKDHNLPIAPESILRVQADAAGIDVTAVYILNHSGKKG